MDIPLIMLISVSTASMRITCVVICLYVDDMLIFGTSLEVVWETKKFLGSKFDMKDLGEAEMILGIKIT